VVYIAKRIKREGVTIADHGSWCWFTVTSPAGTHQYVDDNKTRVEKQLCYILITVTLIYKASLASFVRKSAERRSILYSVITRNRLSSSASSNTNVRENSLRCSFSYLCSVTIALWYNNSLSIIRSGYRTAIMLTTPNPFGVVKILIAHRVSVAAVQEASYKLQVTLTWSTKIIMIIIM